MTVRVRCEFGFEFECESESESAYAKPEMDAAVHSPQLQNSETVIVYCTVCSGIVVLLEIFLVLLNSQYRAQFNCAPNLHESHFGSAVILF